MSSKHFISIGAVGLLFACSSSDNAPPTAPMGLRPGNVDSSRAFQGTPSRAENDFWEAVRRGDDGARQVAVAHLKADVTKDPTNGYSAFLAAASAFIPSADLVRALSTGQVIPPGPPGALPADTGPLLE